MLLVWRRGKLCSVGLDKKEALLCRSGQEGSFALAVGKREALLWMWTRGKLCSRCGQEESFALDVEERKALLCSSYGMGKLCSVGLEVFTDSGLKNVNE